MGAEDQALGAGRAGGLVGQAPVPAASPACQLLMAQLTWWHGHRPQSWLAWAGLCQAPAQSQEPLAGPLNRRCRASPRGCCLADMVEECRVLLALRWQPASLLPDTGWRRPGTLWGPPGGGAATLDTSLPSPPPSACQRLQENLPGTELAICQIMQRQGEERGEV